VQKNNSPNYVWSLNNKQSKHNMSPETSFVNQKWPPKYKNPPIWAQFGFQVDYDVAN
jgi:hypothetical protein